MPQSLTFAVERAEPDALGPVGLYTVDVVTGERIKIATFVEDPEAIQAFWDVFNLAKLCAQERGRLGI